MQLPIFCRRKTFGELLQIKTSKKAFLPQICQAMHLMVKTNVESQEKT